MGKDAEPSSPSSLPRAHLTCLVTRVSWMSGDWVHPRRTLAPPSPALPTLRTLSWWLLPLPKLRLPPYPRPGKQPSPGGRDSLALPSANPML